MPEELEVEVMDRALEKVNQRRWWIWGLFLLCSSPGILNGWHIMVILFFAYSPPHWCQVPELLDEGWTNEQIRNISSPNGISDSSCSMIGWNYSQLADLGYQEALQFVSSNPRPPDYPCAHFTYDEEVPYSSTVSEWDLVCDKLPLKSNIHSSTAFGRFIGGFLFGAIADKYGRKTSFILACLTYIVSGPVGAFAYDYWLFIVSRLLVGIAGTGYFQAAYTILTEVASKERRAGLGCVFNISYPVGYITLPVIALMFPTWRSLQLAISLPALLLLLHCWLMPESPKWLMTQGRRIEAWSIITKIDKSTVPPLAKDITNVQKEVPHVSLWKRKLDGLKQLFALFMTSELCWRVCICYFSWFSVNMCYYILALNADSFSSNRYIYIALSGVVEMPAYVLPIFILKWWGRKLTTVLLYLVTGTAFIIISILIISNESKTIILVLALLGRVADAAVFAVIVLHTSELFPTSNRNTAIGTSFAFGQLGSMSAPYIVDVVGQYSKSFPSTLCGGLAVSSVLLTLLLPETRGKPLMETVQDLKQGHHKDRNYYTFS